jgi:hypothetical protein
VLRPNESGVRLRGAVGREAAVTGNGTGDWTMVDEGWGREPVGFATLSEPANSGGDAERGR